MKQVFKSILWIAVCVSLFGCTTDYLPIASEVLVDPGESQTFTAVSNDDGANLKWRLDGKAVAQGNQYVFTAEANNSDDPIYHKLIAREMGSKYDYWLYKFLDLLGDFAATNQWTIVVNPESIEVGEVVLKDSNNYSFNGSLDIKSYSLAELSDPLIDWSGVTKDLQGHDISVADDIDYTALILFNNITEEEIEQGLSSNTLDQSYITAFVSFETEGQTSANMSEYTLFGNDVDAETYFEEGYGIWLLTIANGSIPGVGTRMAAFITPDPDSTETTLSLSNDTTVLDFQVELETLTPISVPSGTSDYSINWSQLTRKGDGSEFSSRDVDQVMLAHYRDMSLSDIEDQFLDLELIADEMWTASVTSGTSVSFEDLYGTDGPFEGIDSTGTWILALRCTDCANPAPPFFTVLVVGSGTTNDECESGDSQVCYCDDSSEGTSACENGQWSDCSCETADDTIVDSQFGISVEISEVVTTVATVTWSIESVDSLDGAYIEFGLDDDFGSVAPADVTDSGPYETILLGMKPSSRYRFRITAWADGEKYISDVQDLETGDAPRSLPSLTVNTYDASNHDHGFFVTSLFASPPGAVIFDEDGDYVWWYLVGTRDMQINRANMTPDHQWVYMWSTNVQGAAAAGPGNQGNTGGSSQRIIKVRIDGSETEEISLPNGHHDFKILPDGTIAYIEYDNRTINNRTVAGDRIVEIAPDGSTEIIYSVWDDFNYSGAATMQGEGWCHANALDYDADEDVYYMGSKSFSSILKIDRATQKLIYVIGGDASDFTVSTGGTEPFQSQHQFQMKDGNLIVFDNGSQERKYSQGVEYQVNENTMTLTLDWSYQPNPSLFNYTLGDAQFLSNGNRLITFCTSGQIDEVDSNGDLVWRLNMALGGALGYVTWKGSLYE